MLKYLIGLAALVAVAGYFLLDMAGAPPEPAAPVVSDAVVSENDALALATQEDVIAQIATDMRESLPMVVTDRLTLIDAFFHPRMKIMEYTYAATAADARSMRALIEARAETICLEARQLIEMGVTLRNSLEDQNGNLIRRVYFLSQDCQQFY